MSSCRLTVNKCTESVCQLRLDLDNMQLSQPEGTDNQCQVRLSFGVVLLHCIGQGDQFIVSGGSPVPAICGTNSGTHSEY